MKVCVVGNGPSAEGRGSEIDACEFVVRIKQYWTYGANGTGDKINAWAWYGAAVASANAPMACQHWITQSVDEYARREHAKRDGFARLKHIISIQPTGGLRFISGDVVGELSHHLGASPSTGLRAIAMVLAMQPEEIVIAGFDAMDAETDARGDQHRPPCHNLRNEKRTLSELENGQWLKAPCSTRLTWLGRPKQLARNA